MLTFCKAADAVSSGNCFIVFNVLTLKVAGLTMFFQLCKFGLESVANFSNTGARTLTSSDRALGLST